MNTTSAPTSATSRPSTSAASLGPSSSTPSSSSSAPANTSSAAYLLQELQAITSAASSPSSALYGRNSVASSAVRSPPAATASTTSTPEQAEPHRCYICFGTDEDSVGKWVGLPMIPGLLVLSRTKLIDSVMPLIPLMIVGNEQLNVSFPPSPALTISLLPWVRMAYNGLWGGLAQRLETKWRRDKQRANGVAALGMNASIEPELNEMDAATAVAAQAAAEEGEEESFLDRKDLGRMIAGALLMPAISSICGTLLGRIGFVRARIPDTFHRNILGGALFVLFKDLARLYGTYQELKRRRVRRIRDFSEFKDDVR
ncbi:hypothetical protein DFQ27_005575 [Actinomortierella ambigua]|uniref:Uncharacterized protein n=1 Tax=Actinomortierella ambigua TaxID=1343610 RepID=A0A9P6QP71_9FUNG|nr:hypothetical protein DFQ27_005575 [Actinomortierella ambigua]